MIKVLGIGSPFGVDSVGWQVVERLLQSDRLKAYDSAHVQMEWHDRPGARLLTLMAGAAHVFLIDAIVSGRAPGTLHRLENQAIEAMPSLLSTHDMGVAQVLQLGRALNQLPEHLVLYGMEVDLMHRDDHLTKVFTSGILKMKEQIERELLFLLDNSALHTAY